MRASLGLAASRRTTVRLFGDQPLLGGCSEVSANAEIGYDDLAVVVGF